MHVAFWTLTMIIWLVNPDGTKEIDIETHPVPFLSEQNCEFAGEGWALEMADALDSDESWIVQYRCIPGITGLTK